MLNWYLTLISVFIWSLKSVWIFFLIWMGLNEFIYLFIDIWIQVVFFYFYKIKNVLICFRVEKPIVIVKGPCWTYNILFQDVRQIKLFFKVCFGEFWERNRKFDAYIKWFNEILNAFLLQPSCWVLIKPAGMCRCGTTAQLFFSSIF